MTTAPLNPLRDNWPVVKNLLGLLLLVAAGVGLVFTAWDLDWHLGAALLSAGVGYAGWVAATSDS